MVGDGELTRSQQFQKVYQEGQQRKRDEKPHWNACTVCFLNQGNASRNQMCYPCWMLVDPDRAFPSLDSRRIHRDHKQTQGILYDRMRAEEKSIDEAEDGVSSIDKKIEGWREHAEDALQVAPLSRCSSQVRVGRGSMQGWACPSCTLINKTGAKTCETCGTNAPAGGDQFAWECEHCGQGDPEGTRCSGCGTWRPWTCGVCTLSNLCSNVECTACGSKWNPHDKSDPLNGLTAEERAFLQAGAQEEQSRTQGILEGRKRLEKRLSAMNCTEQVMVDDGNCQFRALSFQLWRTQRYHSHLRAIVIDYMKQRRENFVFYFGTPEEFDDYLDRMARVTTWGDEMTLRAASDAMGISVYVAQSESGRWILSYEPETTPDAHTFDLYSPTDKVAPPLRAFMSYQAPVHYNSIVPNECPDTNYRFLVDSVDCMLVEQRVNCDELMRLEDQFPEACEQSPVHKTVETAVAKIAELIEKIKVYNEDKAAEFTKALELLKSGARPPSRAPSVVLSRSVTTPRRPSLDSLTFSTVRRTSTSRLKAMSPTLPDGSPHRSLGESMSQIEETRSIGCDSQVDPESARAFPVTPDFPREPTEALGTTPMQLPSPSPSPSPNGMGDTANLVSPSSEIPCSEIHVDSPPPGSATDAGTEAQEDSIPATRDPSEADQSVQASSPEPVPPPPPSPPHDAAAAADPVTDPVQEPVSEPDVSPETSSQEASPSAGGQNGMTMGEAVTAEQRRIQELRREKVRMLQLERERRERELEAESRRKKEALPEKERPPLHAPKAVPNGVSQPAPAGTAQTFSRRSSRLSRTSSSPRTVVTVRSGSAHSASPCSPAVSSGVTTPHAHLAVNVGSHPKVRTPSAHLMSPIRNMRGKYPLPEEREDEREKEKALGEEDPKAGLKKRRPSMRKLRSTPSTLKRQQGTPAPVAEVRTEPLARNTIIQAETTCSSYPTANNSISNYSADDDFLKPVPQASPPDPVTSTPTNKHVAIGDAGFVYYIDPEAMSPPRSYSVSPMYSRGRPTSPQRRLEPQDDTDDVRHSTTSPVHVRNDAAKRRALSQLTARQHDDDTHPPSYERPTQCFEARKKGAEQLMNKLPKRPMEVNLSSFAGGGRKPLGGSLRGIRQPTVPFGGSLKSLKSDSGVGILKAGSSTPRGGNPNPKSPSANAGRLSRTSSMQLPNATRQRSGSSPKGRLASSSPVKLANTTGGHAPRSASLEPRIHLQFGESRSRLPRTRHSEGSPQSRRSPIKKRPK